MKENISRLIAVVAAVIVTALVAWGIYYLTCPALTFRSSGFWWYLLGVLVILVINMAIALAISNRVTDSYWDDNSSGFIVGVTILIVGVFVLAFITTSMIGWKAFNPSKYANLIEVADANFEDDIPELDPQNAMTIDLDAARKLGDRVLATIPNAVWYDVDNEYNLVSIKVEKNGESQNELYRISPINYGDIFKYGKAKEYGIPGFVIVNAHTGEYKVQQFAEPMKYSPSAYWSYDLTRHLRMRYPSYVFGRSFFEVDDELTPYWITPVREAKVGVYSAQVTKAVILTNAVTGDTELYSSGVPEWVDHIESVIYLYNLVEWHYRYQNGWPNLSKTGVYHTTAHYPDVGDGYNTLVTKDGKIWFSTGLTPANGSESNAGFLLMNPRTGEMRKYNCNNAEESSAMAAAQGLVQNYGYKATFPIIVNVDGHETYYMQLKDNSGLVKRYALCDVSRYTTVVQAETLEKAIALYKGKIASVGRTSTDGYQSRITGCIEEFSAAEIEGFTYYYFTIAGTENNLIFKSSIENSSLQPLKIKTGQKVTIEYYPSSEEDGVAIVTSIQFTD